MQFYWFDKTGLAELNVNIEKVFKFKFAVLFGFYWILIVRVRVKVDSDDENYSVSLCIWWFNYNIIITSNLVDPASSHMLISKTKPCMSKYKLLYSETANSSLKQL